MVFGSNLDGWLCLYIFCIVVGNLMLLEEIWKYMIVIRDVLGVFLVRIFML